MIKKPKPFTKKSKKKKLSPTEKAQHFEKRMHEREIALILKNLGFHKLLNIEGKEFEYDSRKGELDDIFINENIILLLEYTTGDPSPHLIKKKVLFDKINADKGAFIEFLLKDKSFSAFQAYYNEKIKNKYSKNELRLKILYCSKKTVPDDHKKLVDAIFFDYNIVQYFKSLTKVVKKSSKYEFFEFIEIPFAQFAENIKSSSSCNVNTFQGHILPEEKSSFAEGLKIVTFYIDADSLIKRAYVLRRNGWREKENIGFYQRMFEGKKIASMRRYLVEKNRVFINNIISTISTKHIKLYDKEGTLLKFKPDGSLVNQNTTEVIPAKIEIIDECNIIGLIDGQHRTYAYHEGDDQFEQKIASLRKIQNLLVTGILFPQTMNRRQQLTFEANLFLEINSNQTNVKTQLKQEIELMINPFSSISIGKKILHGLNKNGPLANLIEQNWFEKGKIKTASIVSFGLKPLIKIDDTKSKDSLFSLWDHPEKQKLKDKNDQESNILDIYIDFSIQKIRDLFIAFKANLTKEQWEIQTPKTPDGILSVTFINGVLNVLRLIIQNKKASDSNAYLAILEKVSDFKFKTFKSSQYRKMGEEIFAKFFNRT